MCSQVNTSTPHSAPSFVLSSKETIFDLKFALFESYFQNMTAKNAKLAEKPLFSNLKRDGCGMWASTIPFSLYFQNLAPLFSHIFVAHLEPVCMQKIIVWEEQTFCWRICLKYTKKTKKWVFNLSFGFICVKIHPSRGRLLKKKAQE